MAQFLTIFYLDNFDKFCKKFNRVLKKIMADETKFQIHFSKIAIINLALIKFTIYRTRSMIFYLNNFDKFWKKFNQEL